MVGTGHYSNKCGTCRRRKLKCGTYSGPDTPLRISTESATGEEKPACIRCKRAGLECEGYERNFKWVDEGKPFFEIKEARAQ